MCPPGGSSSACSVGRLPLLGGSRSPAMCALVANGEHSTIPNTSGAITPLYITADKSPKQLRIKS
eukprot:8557523-Pyramimonas_sp.AAC.1